MSMGQRIAQARKEAGLSQQTVANRFGISRAAVAQWENGDTFPGSAKLEGLAEVLGVSLEWLATGRGTKRPPSDDSQAPAGLGVREIPVLTPIRAGSWPDRSGAAPNGKLFTDIELGPDAFALVIEDQSMEPEFAEGDKVIVDPDVLPRPRDYVVAVLSPEDGAVFRMHRPQEREGRNAVELVPFNAAWPTRVIDADNPGRIIGTMMEHRRFRRP